ncbi:MICOS complex subunit [Aphelenchoides besseyi]|nr:MICOS complex subunit [Aphelenchoides besseyi]KAI6208416.1 MICOS complex subunit [Aphelenchoides besseyi]
MTSNQQSSSTGGIKIKDLPIYGEPKPLNTAKFVEEEPLPLQHEFATLRYAFRDFYSVISDRFKPVDRAVQTAKETVVSTDEYLRREGTVLPKAAAITVGGLAGFVLGLRRSGFRKLLYTTTGLLTMAAFTYPYEAIEFSQTGWLHAKRAWLDFRESPEPTNKTK